MTSSRPKRYVRTRILLFFTYLLHVLLFGLGRIFLRRVSMEIRGTKHLHALKESAIFAPNHASVLDPSVLCIALARSRMLRNSLPLISVAREKSFYKGMAYPQPYFYGGILFKLLGALEVTPRSARDPNDKTEDTLAMHTQLLLDGFFVLIFPEGAITRSGELLPPKLGAAKLSQRTQRPIVPVAIKEAFQLDPWKLIRGNVHIVVSFAKPMYPRPTSSFIPNEHFVAVSHELMRNIGASLQNTD